MTRLEHAGTDALRAELAKRDRIAETERAEARREWVRSEYGVCKAEPGVTGHAFTLRSDEPFPVGPCGEEFTGYEARELRQILQTPPGWPPLVPCPPAQALLVGAVYEIKLTCSRGHATYSEKTMLRNEPLKPLFKV